MGNKEILVHMDRLEYTRDGLRSRQPISLEVGSHNQVVLVRPDRVGPVRPGNRGFSNDSSLPLTSTLRVFWALQTQRTAFAHEPGQASNGSGVFQVLGHTSRSGDEAYNKGLAERRADVGLSLLTGDPTLATQVAEAEDWGPREGQILLRLLACDPGPADGEFERLSLEALKVFADRYNRGVFHAEAAEQQPEPALDPGQGWSASARTALVEALVLAHGSRVAQDQLVPGHAAHGCSEFNAPASDRDEDARRLVLIQHPGAPQYPDALPCRRGDDFACAVVDEAPQRCMYYREHFAESGVAPLKIYDPRWLWISEDKYVLSALTTAPDEQSLVFDVYPQKQAGEPLARLEAVTSAGLVSVVWKSGLAHDETGRPALAGTPSFVVRTEDGAAKARAPYPEIGAFRIMVGCADDARQPSSKERFRLTTSDGAYDQTLSVAEHAARVSPTMLALEFQGVPLSSVGTLLYGFDDDPRFKWFSGRVLHEVNVARHGGDAYDGEPEAKPDHAQWSHVDHRDAIAGHLAKRSGARPRSPWG